MRLLAASCALAITCAPVRVARAGVPPSKAIPVSAVALVLDGEPARVRPSDGARQAVFDLALEKLRPHGFVVLPTSVFSDLLGGEALAAAEIGILHIDLREPGFSFRAGYRARAGRIEVTDAASGKRLYKRDVDVRSDLPFDAVRRQIAMEPLAAQLSQLRTAPNLLGRTNPFVVLLLQVNDIGRDQGGFITAARRLAALSALPDTGPLIDIAADPRSAADPAMRAEFLRRAVTTRGPRAIPRLASALTRAALADTEDAALTALLVESLEQVGASPGDQLLPALRGQPLGKVLQARGRFTFRQGLAELDRRIGELARAAVEATDGFAAAAALVGSLPLGSLPAGTRRSLRDALYTRIPPGDAAVALERLRRLFPAEQYPPEEEDRLDEVYLASAAQLARAPEAARLAHYRDYLGAAGRARAAQRLAVGLAIEPALEAELVRRLGSAPAGGGGDADLVAVYGPTPWPGARAALARARYAALGDAPSDAALLALRAAHGGIEPVETAVRERGLVRDRERHVFPVALGDGLGAVMRVLGRPGDREEGLERRDLSPAAAVRASGRISGRIPASAAQGFAAFDYPGRARVLFKDGSAFRVLIDESNGKFHHGVRTGDRREEALLALGPPSAERSLMFGREVLTWSGLHGGQGEIHLVFDRGRLSFLWEEQPDAAKTMLAGLR